VSCSGSYLITVFLAVLLSLLIFVCLACRHFYIVFFDCAVPTIQQMDSPNAAPPRQFDETVICSVLGMISIEQQFFRAAVRGNLTSIQETLSYHRLALNVSNEYGWTALHLACFYGQVTVAKCLLEQYAVNAHATTKDHGWTAMHVAACTGQLGMVAYLMNLGFGEATTSQGSTTLHIAAEFNQLCIVKYLVEAWKVDPTVTNGKGYTPLYISSAKGHVDIVKYLVKRASRQQVVGWRNNATFQYLVGRNADVNIKTSEELGALHVSIRQDHLTVVQCLTEHNVALVHTSNAQGRTALHLASFLGRLSIVKHLVQKCGVNTKAKTATGCTAIHLATIAGHVEIVEFLLFRASIDIDAKCNGGSTALHFACTKGKLDMVKALVQAGASLSTMDPCEWAALHRASYHGRVDTVRYLVEAGAKADGFTEAGDTSLHLASQQGHLRVIEYLLGTGAVDVKKSALEDGSTALHFACQFGCLVVAQYLVEHTLASIDGATSAAWPAEHEQGGVDTRNLDFIGINQKVELVGDNDGTTALHVACFHGNLSIVEYLLDKCHTHVEETDHNGMNALQFAIEGGQFLIVQTLVAKRGADLDVTTPTTGATLLHLACEVGSLYIVQYLVKSCRADVHALNYDGKTPLECAKLGNNKAVVEFLEERNSCKRLLRSRLGV
jgi:ankyrin repeat protein